MVTRSNKFGVHLSNRGNHKKLKMAQLATKNNKETVNENGTVVAVTTPKNVTPSMTK
ncbi:MAG: hypothetical protein ACI9JN_002678 [Bacteroidia bacterium]|jgi:hypothetical protein